MPLDGIVADCLALELNEELSGGKIVKIFQPETEEICFHILAKGMARKLLISANPSHPRIHLTLAAKENPYTAPAFCMLLRKHLLGGKILEIGINDFERIFTINIEAADELGEMSIKKIIAEIMGRHSNIILVNEGGKIIDSIKRIDSTISRVREVLPGREYKLPPPQEKISPLDIEKINKILEDPSCSGVSTSVGASMSRGASTSMGASMSRDTDINININAGINTNTSTSIGIGKYLLNNIKGFSPFLCREICFVAGIDENIFAADLMKDEKLFCSLKKALFDVIETIKNKKYNPCIIYECADHYKRVNKSSNDDEFVNSNDLAENNKLIDNNDNASISINGTADNNTSISADEIADNNDNTEKKPLDYHCIKVKQYPVVKYFDSMSLVLDKFYSEKDFAEKLNQKKNSIAKIINTNLERCKKKLSIQEEALREAADREKLRLCGELITAYIYSIPIGSKSVILPNYYSQSNELVEIELDENKTPQENAQSYFKRYNKAKSIYNNATLQAKETREEIYYLESVLHHLDNCDSLVDIEELKEELVEQGYIVIKQKKSGMKISPNKKKGLGKASASSSKSYSNPKPIKFKSSDGFDIYAGKNNKQNDFLTFKFAGQKDIWLHVKDIPGPHTIIKCNKNEVSDIALKEAANIAAWYSKASRSSNVPVDYTLVKNVKKISGAKPGMVIYDNYKTIFVTPDESLVKKLKVETETEAKIK